MKYFLNIIRLLLLLHAVLLRPRVIKKFVVLFCNPLILKSNYLHERLFQRFLSECSSGCRKTKHLAIYLLSQLNVYILSFDHLSEENLLTWCTRFYPYHDNLIIPAITSGFWNNDLLPLTPTFCLGSGSRQTDVNPDALVLLTCAPHRAAGSTRLFPRGSFPWLPISLLLIFLFFAFRLQSLSLLHHPLTFHLKDLESGGCLFPAAAHHLPTHLLWGTDPGSTTGHQIQSLAKILEGIVNIQR